MECWGVPYPFRKSMKNHMNRNKLDPKAEIVEDKVYKSGFEWRPKILKTLDYRKLSQYPLSGCHLCLLCGVSTAGKNTLLDKVLVQTKDVKLIPRATSRLPRPGEHEGVEYFFTVDQALLWSQYGGNYYAVTEEVLKRLSKVKKGVMIQGIVYAPAMKHLFEKLGVKITLIYVLPVKLSDGLTKAMKVVRPRLLLRHRKVAKLRLGSVSTELSYVFSHFGYLKKLGVVFVENPPSAEGFSPKAVKMLLSLFEKHNHETRR